MKQVLQSIGKGKVQVVEVPWPVIGDGKVLVQVGSSLVSAGTERMITKFSSKNLLAKAKSRPDLVKHVLDKCRREGLLTAIESVRNRFDSPFSLGYSCAGEVIQIGSGVENYRVGEWVACAGAGYAVHAEVVCVPKNLVVKVPSTVDLESAAFTTLGAIALQGIRLAEARLGETVAVIGLGLLGQLSVQILKACGCRVAATDVRKDRTELARNLGTDVSSSDPESFLLQCLDLSHGRGADSILITADTESDQPVELAGRVARDKGVVVAVGDIGTRLPRKLYFEKELDFRISRSYGPGRYDPDYEEHGQDYPIGYVRWTENRNMQAFVELVGAGKLDLGSLVTHRFPLNEADKAYELISGKSHEPFLGIVITYPDRSSPSKLWLRADDSKSVSEARSSSLDALRVGMIGAGNFATAVLLPAMKRVSGIELVSVCSAQGSSARFAGGKFSFHYCAASAEQILADPKINTIVIATRHNLHWGQVVAALQQGKHVFCEKPLCLNEGELRDIVRTFGKAQKSAEAEGRREPILTVGYNRRFAPLSLRMKSLVDETPEPVVIHYRVNAGYIPKENWVQDRELGGGRIIGEVCHFVDFMSFITGAAPVRVEARTLSNMGRYNDDNLTAMLEFADGSLGSISYVANGDRSVPKERVEIFGGGRVAILDDFRRLQIARLGRKQIFRSRLRKDKGHRAEWTAFKKALEYSTALPIPLEELVGTSLATFLLLESIRTRAPQELDLRGFLSSIDES